MRAAAVVVLLVAAACGVVVSAGDKVPCPSDCTSASNGVCLSTGICECKLGFSGSACETSYCPNDCGAATGNGGCSLESKSCDCNDGWTGRACADSTICPNDCGDYGVCKDDMCKCDDKHSGVACDKKRCPHDCSGTSSGTCNGNTGECSCVDGLSGDDCSLFCLGNCSSNGACVSQRCQCFVGFAGSDCSDRLCLNDCSSQGTCNPRTGTCTCKPGWHGKDCSKNGCNLQNYTGRVFACSNHGVCENPGTASKMACKCDEGWTGVFCAIIKCKEDCNARGFCNNGTCECKAGYAGDACGMDTCYSGCSGHGKCEQHACACDKGYNGDDCNQKVCPDNCGGVLKGQCNKEGACDCAPGYNGADCGSKSCPQDCNKDAGVCNGTTGKCKCALGKIGLSCSVTGCAVPDCSNHGQCMKGLCTCVEGYEGDYCSVALCPSANKTGPAKVCSGHGSCAQVEKPANGTGNETVTTGVCTCAMGYAGDDCATTKCPAECLNGGICNAGTDQCECRPGFSGPDCSERGCKAKAGNVKSSCANEGVCSADWKCTCSINFGGDYCERKLCPNRCNGKGKCDTATGLCKCSAGFEGADCDTKVCVLAQQGCSGHGACAKGVCNCTTGYSGFACQSTNHCPGDDCSGHGECQAPASGKGMGKCVCAAPWDGDEGCGSVKCPRNDKGLMCGGNGDCEIDNVDNTKTVCECNVGYGGTNCESIKCKNDCSGNGECENKGQALGGVCKCKGDFGGADCKGKACPKNVRGWECSNSPNSTIPNKRGKCQRDNGTCVCAPGLKGDSCDKVPSKAFCASGCEDKCATECAAAGQQNDAMYTGCHAECNGRCMSDCLMGKQKESVDVAYNPDLNVTRVLDSSVDDAAKKANDDALAVMQAKGVTKQEKEQQAKSKAMKEPGHVMSEADIYPVDPRVPTLAADSDADVPNAGKAVAAGSKLTPAQVMTPSGEKLMTEDANNKQIVVEVDVDYTWVIQNEARFSDNFVKDMAKQSGLDAAAISVLGVKAGSTVVYARISTDAIVQHQGDWSAADWQTHFATNLQPDAFPALTALVGSRIRGKSVKQEPCNKP